MIRLIFKIKLHITALYSEAIKYIIVLIYSILNQFKIRYLVNAIDVLFYSIIFILKISNNFYKTESKY